jgi:hypothetical protein
VPNRAKAPPMVTISSLGWKAGPADRAQSHLFQALCEFADETGFLFPRMETIAKRSRQTVRNTRTIMHEIEEDGWVRVKKVGRAHQYEINLNQLCTRALLAKSEKFDRRECEFILLHAGVIMPLPMRTDAAKAALQERTNKDGAAKKPPDAAAPSTPAECAEILFERLTLVASAEMRRLAADAIRMHAKSMNTPIQEAMLVIERRALDDIGRGETVNNFWFVDDKWKGRSAAKSKSELAQEAQAARARVGMHIPEKQGPTSKVNLTTSAIREGFNQVLSEVRKEIASTNSPTGEERSGACDECFAGIEYESHESQEGESGRISLVVSSPDPKATEAGLRRHRQVVEASMKANFGFVIPVQVVGVGALA